ncbi:uncharacterized protein LOC135701234 [Ochlerotatus camptorhynchus]|uniref:uncharacterized protein LOC135701234 n=1 Tax=Ochlerotatus camptorhynchus TaxID=644619 RepID=UPI0031DB0509
MRVLGSDAWVHVQDEKRNKLDRKAMKLKFVSYAENRKAYRFVNTTTDRILISCDAKFPELEMDSQESVREMGKPKNTEVEMTLGNNAPPETNQDENSETETKEDSEVETEEEPDETMRPDEGETIYYSASENKFFGAASTIRGGGGIRTCYQPSFVSDATCHCEQE